MKLVAFGVKYGMRLDRILRICQSSSFVNLNMDTAKPIYILGAGPAGLAAAYTLTQQGQSVVVVERDSRVGGLAKSIEYKGLILD